MNDSDRLAALAIEGFRLIAGWTTSEAKNLVEELWQYWLYLKESPDPYLGLMDIPVSEMKKES